MGEEQQPKRTANPGIHRREKQEQTLLKIECCALKAWPHCISHIARASCMRHAFNLLHGCMNMHVASWLLGCVDLWWGPFISIMAWNGTDFVKELGDIEKLLALNPNKGLQEGLVKALLTKCDHSQLAAGDYVAMLEKVDHSTLSDELKATLKDSLLLRASTGTTNEGSSAIVKTPQTLVNIPAYLTRAEMTEVVSGNLYDVPHIIIKRLSALGVKSLKETTKRAAIALIVQSIMWHGKSRPSADEIYGLAQQFGLLFGAHKASGCMVSGLKTYPHLPTDLDKDWLARAYPKDQPSMLDLPQLFELGAQCPMRSTSKLLSNCSKKKLQPLVDKVEDRLLELCKSLLGGNLQAALQGCKENSSSGAKITFFDHVKDGSHAAEDSKQGLSKEEVSKQLALPLTNQPSAAAEPQQQPSSSQQGHAAAGSGSGDLSLEDYEKLAMIEIEDKNAKKAKTSGDKEDKKSNPKKQTAGKKDKKNEKKPKKVMKKPAATKVAKGYGCLRCRGSGCDTCMNDDFGGLRLVGREAWKEYMHQQKRKLC